MPTRSMTKWHGALPAALWLAAAGCSASPRAIEPTDCNAGNAYELSAPLRTFETEATWYGSGDSSVDKTVAAPARPDPACGVGGAPPDVVDTSVSFARVPIEGGGRCGSTYALELRSAGHTDWGSLFGDYDLAANPWDGSGYEGLAIWARSGGGDGIVSIVLNTWQTSADGTKGKNIDPAMVCKVDCSLGSGTRSIDEAGNTLSQSYVSPPGTCGNGFQRELHVTTDWQLLLLPFDSFWQELKPNAVKDGLDPTHINGMLIRAPKEADMDLWIDDIAFYKRK